MPLYLISITIQNDRDDEDTRQTDDYVHADSALAILQPLTGLLRAMPSAGEAPVQEIASAPDADVDNWDYLD